MIEVLFKHPNPARSKLKKISSYHIASYGLLQGMMNCEKNGMRHYLNVKYENN
jgi:hypothetical protein